MFGVNFADGRIKGYPTGSMPGRGEKRFHVMYVRGNTDYGRNDFVDNGDGTVSPALNIRVTEESGRRLRGIVYGQMQGDSSADFSCYVSTSGMRRCLSTRLNLYRTCRREESLKLGIITQLMVWISLVPLSQRYIYCLRVL